MSRLGLIFTLTLICLFRASTTFGQRIGDRIVVTIETAPLKTLNDITGCAPKGSILTVDAVHGDWFWVSHSRGSITTSGWLKQSSFVPVRNAIELFTAELGRSPVAELFAVRGAIWEELGDFDKAIADHSAAIRLDQSNAAIYYNRGYLLSRKSDYDNAILDFTASIRLNPRDAGVYYSRGYARGCKGGEFELEIADYNEAIRLDPDNAAAYRSRGYAWAQEGMHQKAVADYTESVRLGNTEADIFFNRGNAWVRLGEYEKAVADYGESIRLSPHDGVTHDARGHVWELLGERDKALADFSQSTRLAGRRPLAAIVFEGNRIAKSEDLLGLLASQPGRAFDRQHAVEDVGKLMATRRFLSVQPRADESPAGLVLVFHVVEMPVIETVTFIGNMAYSDETLAQMTNLVNGRLYDVGANLESCRRIEGFYRKNGYRNVNVYLEKGASWEGRNVVVKIAEGGKFVVPKFDGTDNEFERDAKIGPHPGPNSRGEIDDNIVESFAVAGDGDDILIPVTVDGQEYWFVHDTGCTVSVFDTSLRSKLIPTNELIPFNGSGQIALYGCRKATVGRSKIPLGQWALCIDLTKFREMSGHDIRGILGMDVLQWWVVQIDFDAGRVRFLKNSDSAHGDKIQLEFNGRRCPTVMTRFGDKLDFRLKIDTGIIGLTDGALSQQTLDAVIRNCRVEVLGTTDIETLTGSQSGKTARIEKISVGEFKHSGQIFYESGPDALGLGYLSRFNVTLDFPARCLFLAKGKQFDRQFSHNDSEPRILLINGVLVVPYVNPDAATCLLESGDRILDVNGRDVRTMSVYSVRLLMSESSNCLQMTVQSENGERRTVCPFPSFEGRSKIPE